MSDKIYLCKRQYETPGIRVECTICYDPPENCPIKLIHRGCIYAKTVDIDTGRWKMQKPNACSNCMYFESVNQIEGSVEGYCRKHAPVTDGRSTKEAYRNRYPVTHDYEWCGEWKEAK